MHRSDNPLFILLYIARSISKQASLKYLYGKSQVDIGIRMVFASSDHCHVH